MKLTKLILCMLFVTICISSKAQDKFTISGTVSSAKTGETLIGASIRIVNTSFGTVSNEYGFFSITLMPGTYSIEVTSIGLEPSVQEITLDKNIKLKIPLADASAQMSEVTVRSVPKGRSITSPQMGVEHLTANEIKGIPALFGEKDVLKAIQLLPGIQSAGDGNSGFYVRGGAADQNLILLDEAPVYNASHLLGFFSTFNPDAVKDITVYKGGMPAQYGGRLSSVVDVTMNDGNNQDYKVSGGVGLISAKLNVEGPIQKSKSSFLVTGRRTYADVFLKLSKDSSLKDDKLYFYDLNAKMNYELGKNDKLFLSGYFGRDDLGFGSTFGLNWGNATATLRWNHVFNDKLFSNTSLIYSDYDDKITINTGAIDANIFSQIKDWNLKEELQLFLNNKNNIRFGFNTILHTMRPGEVSSASGSSINSSSLQDRYSWENAIYASDTWQASEKINVTYGARLTAFSILGKGDFYNIDSSGKVTDTLHYSPGQFVKTYLNLEPRLAISYVFNPSTSIKASYVRNVQNLHLISNSTAALPTDKWVASTNIIKPEISDQVALGYYKDLANSKYELTIETYYKALQNQIDYRDGANVYNNDAIETQLLFGIGRAYGLEMMVKKQVGKVTGWVSYTLSKTEVKINGINDDKWYNATQDHTHNIAITLSYQRNKKWSFAANWVFYTGAAVTYPSGKYTVGGETVFYYTGRNQYRFPDYHRLDLSATCQLKQHKHYSSELNFSLYNAYGRANAYSIDFQQSTTNPEQTEAVQTSLFKMIPSISYNFKF
jgi:CarboxypepD_reg-like domain/TonB-dependent Receptor Plug Domain